MSKPDTTDEVGVSEPVEAKKEETTSGKRVGSLTIDQAAGHIPNLLFGFLGRISQRESAKRAAEESYARLFYGNVSFRFKENACEVTAKSGGIFFPKKIKLNLTDPLLISHLKGLTRDQNLKKEDIFLSAGIVHKNGTYFMNINFAGDVSSFYLAFPSTWLHAISIKSDSFQTPEEAVNSLDAVGECDDLKIALLNGFKKANTPQSSLA